MEVFQNRAQGWWQGSSESQEQKHGESTRAPLNRSSSNRALLPPPQGHNVTLQKEFLQVVTEHLLCEYDGSWSGQSIARAAHGQTAVPGDVTPLRSEAERYWNAQCNWLWEKSLTAFHFTFISTEVTPLSSSTLNTVLTKLHISHVLSAASHLELLCVLGIYCSILHWFAEGSSETSQVCNSVDLYRSCSQASSNSPDMAAVYSTILTVLYAVPDKLRESPLLFQMPPEKQDREWKDKDGAQKRTGELLPKAVPISPMTAEPVQLNSQAELAETRKSLDYFPAKN